MDLDLDAAGTGLLAVLSVLEVADDLTDDPADGFGLLAIHVALHGLPSLLEAVPQLIDFLCESLPVLRERLETHLQLGDSLLEPCQLLVRHPPGLGALQGGVILDHEVELLLPLRQLRLDRTATF